MPAKPLNAHQPCWPTIAATLGRITARNTAFPTFTDLVTAPAYWPSLNVSTPDRAALADAYDLAQARRKDSRRVNRYSTTQ
jgi:hypothetical protein